MELIHWIYVACGIISAISLYFSFHPKFYKPENIIVENGNEVLIAHLPKAKPSEKYAKRIAKSHVAKIQLAGNYVTLFNASGNAIDIWLPNNKLAVPIFKRAQQIFSDAEHVTIEC